MIIEWTRRIALAAFALALSVTAAFALDLATAKSQGLVGEKPDGYIAAVSGTPSPDVVQLVNQVNAQRGAEYQKIAAQTAGANVAAVEQLAGQKLIAKTAPGQYYMAPNGTWQQK